MCSNALKKYIIPAECLKLKSDVSLSLTDGVGRETCKKVVNKRYKAYKARKTQTLHDANLELRLRFCRWALEQYAQDRYFFRGMLFSDEAKISQKDIFNA